MSDRADKRKKPKTVVVKDFQNHPETKADWSGKCENCGATPIVPATGLCGPCTFGEAETAGGNW